MYDWRKMTDEERARAEELRRVRGFPKHSPPHWDLEGERQYLISSACFEHAHIIGKNAERMTGCEAALLQCCREFCSAIYAWCVLPNHYHILVLTEAIKGCLPDWAGSTGARHFSGMETTELEAGNAGTTASSGQ